MHLYICAVIASIGLGVVLGATFGPRATRKIEPVEPEPRVGTYYSCDTWDIEKEVEHNFWEMYHDLAEQIALDREEVKKGDYVLVTKDDMAGAKYIIDYELRHLTMTDEGSNDV